MIAFYEKGNIYCTNDNDIVPYKSVNLEVPDGTSPLDLIYDGKTLRIKNETEKEADRIAKEKEEAKREIIQSDNIMIRVIDDIIEILLTKNIISNNDLPQAVKNTLNYRKKLRNKIS